MRLLSRCGVHAVGNDAGGAAEAPLSQARARFVERRYDCLGCQICWPADALNVASGMADVPIPACGAPLPPRQTWPPYPGDYVVLDPTAPLAICTLHDRALFDSLSQSRPAGVAIIGTLVTENLGIERIVENVATNPAVRVLVLCGSDTAGRIGHFPGQSMLALLEHGTDDSGRIVGAQGRRPVLKNVSRSTVDGFRRQLRAVDRRGESRLEELQSLLSELRRTLPPEGNAGGRLAWPAEPALPAAPPGRLILDPAGYVVIVPDRRRGLLRAEHFESRGIRTRTVEGSRAVDVMATLLRENLVTRLDHAAYLGRELALAELAVSEGRSYVQDAAPEPEEACSCNTEVM